MKFPRARLAMVEHEEGIFISLCVTLANARQNEIQKLKSILLMKTCEIESQQYCQQPPVAMCNRGKTDPLVLDAGI